MKLTCSSVKIKLSWKMIGQASLVTYKIDIHGSLLNIFAHWVILDKERRARSKQISIFFEHFSKLDLSKFKIAW
jgi:hypothetical protein